MATTKLRPFQKKTVEAALAAFSQKDRPKRFLVADEVGLGKTVVAQELIRQLTKGRNNPLTVFYVCSNMSIASQNRSKLLEIVGDDETAACRVDRLSLMPAEDPPTHPKLHLYTLTPATSLPRRTTRPGGRYQERALIFALFKQTWPELVEKHFPPSLFKLQASWNTWNWNVEYQLSKVQKNTTLVGSFRQAIRTEFQIGPGKHTITSLRKLNFYELIWRCRRAMADVALKNINPDIVIFDEFQRFPHLVESKVGKAEARILNRLRGEASNSRIRLLLLSATPYRLYSSRWEDNNNQSHLSDFFKLVEFLYGEDGPAATIRQQCEHAFDQLEQELRRGQPNSDAAVRARGDAESLLRPIMARTERADFNGGHVAYETNSLETMLEPADLKVFQHLSHSLDSSHRSSAIPFWHSIPFPMQTMGKKYTTWKRAESIDKGDTPYLSVRRRNRFILPKEWPHHRLRKLIETLDLNAYALPWVAPSKCWWPLDARWDNGPEKLLIFSRYRAVPQAVSACVSYAVEVHLLGKTEMKYEAVTRNKRLVASESRHNLIALFNPDPWLINNVDPLRGGYGSLDEIRLRVQRQVIRALRQLGVRVQSSKVERVRPVWQLLAALNRQAGYFPMIIGAWRTIHQEGGKGESTSDISRGLGALLDRWASEAINPVNVIDRDEVNDIVNYALGAPGVVVGRALQRHWNECLNPRHFLTTLSVSWNGLRTYLDQQWFAAALDGLADYPSALLKAMIGGNLESVLDEHLYMLGVLYASKGKELADSLANGMTARTSNFFLHQLGNKNGKTFSLRCHVALPFTESVSVDVRTGEQKSYRPDELRRAFNSPFWPHILTTTSIGQEGLDFHIWCRSILHWDLGYNPVDLEQREGRIQRFGALNIRRGMVAALEARGIHPRGGGSPWVRIGDAAERHLQDPSGLAPWWVLGEAEISRYIFDMPLSEQQQHFDRLKEQRLLYRLVLGQPDQEDLTDLLLRRGVLEYDELEDALVQLSPWFSLK